MKGMKGRPDPQQQDRRLVLPALLTGSVIGLGLVAWVLRGHPTELWAVLICLPPYLVWTFRRLIWPQKFPSLPVKVAVLTDPPQSEPPAETHFEFQLNSPFQAGEHLSAWLTVPLAEAEKALAEGRWLMLMHGKQAEPLAATLERVDLWLPTQAKFRMTFAVPRYLSGKNWNLHIGSQSFPLPELLPTTLRPLLEPPLTPAQAAKALLSGQEQPTLRRMYGLSPDEYVTYAEVTPAERRAAFCITDTELAALATAQGWSAQYIDASIRWEGGPFLWQQQGGSFRVVVRAERGTVEDIGTTPDLTEATRLLLRERFGWLPEG